MSTQFGTVEEFPHLDNPTVFESEDDTLGPFMDGELEGGEREGIQHLFAGAIATFENPLGHGQVDYDDPTEASEVVLLADLLMRLIDRMAATKRLED